MRATSARWRRGMDFPASRGVEPSFEPRPRAPRIHYRWRPQVPEEIEKDVREPAPDLARGAQHVAVIALLPHRPAPAQRTVDGPCTADREPLNAAPERGNVVRLHDQVQVVRLHRELDDAK